MEVGGGEEAISSFKREFLDERKNFGVKKGLTDLEIIRLQ